MHRDTAIEFFSSRFDFFRANNLDHFRLGHWGQKLYACHVQKFVPLGGENGKSLPSSALRRENRILLSTGSGATCRHYAYFIQFCVNAI